ncbi:MerR family transcriptional regulator [Clostridium sp. C8-1-8]|uniref:MerR family transcriptional regulator n=1 Tax=Clostridium sp. C8-1-8 TaxID=2698831 RepID=UPI00136B9FA1|nr:MerR family transcriptional regulator [Clostridium sp. C8-1-8]
MNISTLSIKTGASVRSLRYYESKGLLKCERLENGYRDFHASMIERVKTIQTYLSLGLSTDEIGQIIECPVSMISKQPLCDKALKAYKIKLSEVENQIEILQKLKSQLQRTISDFE